MGSRVRWRDRILPALRGQALPESALRRQCGAGPKGSGEDTFDQAIRGLIAAGEIEVTGRRSDFEDKVSPGEDERVFARK
jgi:hypothetical protein